MNEQIKKDECLIDPDYDGGMNCYHSPECETIGDCDERNLKSLSPCRNKTKCGIFCTARCLEVDGLNKDRLLLQDLTIWPLTASDFLGTTKVMNLEKIEALLAAQSRVTRKETLEEVISKYGSYNDGCGCCAGTDIKTELQSLINKNE